MSVEQQLDPSDQQSSPLTPREAFIENIIRATEVPDRVVNAFAAVDRAEFTPIAGRQDAYTDKIISLGEGSSISQPSLVAQMIAFVNPKPGDCALEVGTATGYQASVISQIVDHVDTIEINPKLAEQAQKNIDRLGYNDKITIHTGDGAKGIEGKTFDNIIVTAALKEIPQALLDQLANNGFMVAPVGPNLSESTLTMYTKDDSGEVTIHDIFKCHFVPVETDSSGGWTKAEIEKADKMHFMHSVVNHLKQQGKDPVEVIKQLGLEVSNIIGRSEPLDIGETLDIMKASSESMRPDNKEPVFEQDSTS